MRAAHLGASFCAAGSGGLRHLMAGLDAIQLLRAYAVGLFPMAPAADSDELHWFDPDPRGILPLDRFHVPQRLRRTVRSGRFLVEIDRDFGGVVAACGEATPTRPETWISEDIKRLYTELHGLGAAHSVEVRREGQLVGGLYGVSLAGAFFGESMFSRETDASKVALVHLVARLRAAGYVLLDTQFVTDHLSRFGARTITRREYRRLLGQALQRECRFTEVDQARATADLLAAYSAPVQDKTQTS